VTLLEGIRGSGSDAFGECHNLTSVTLPASLSNLASEVFLDCTSMTNVVFTAGLGQVGFYMFTAKRRTRGQCDGHLRRCRLRLWSRLGSYSYGGPVKLK
jgi:hypothetical protein